MVGPKFKYESPCPKKRRRQIRPEIICRQCYVTTWYSFKVRFPLISECWMVFNVRIWPESLRRRTRRPTTANCLFNKVLWRIHDMTSVLRPLSPLLAKTTPCVNSASCYDARTFTTVAFQNRMSKEHFKLFELLYSLVTDSITVVLWIYNQRRPHIVMAEAF